MKTAKTRNLPKKIPGLCAIGGDAVSTVIVNNDKKFHYILTPVPYITGPNKFLEVFNSEISTNSKLNSSRLNIFIHLPFIEFILRIYLLFSNVKLFSLFFPNFEFKFSFYL